MKIRRFYAKKLRDALRQVKEELGSDAVILSNNKVEGGLELVAAVDYDESKIQESLDKSAMPAADKAARASRDSLKTERRYGFDEANDELAQDYDSRFPRKENTQKIDTQPKWIEQLKQRQNDNLARISSEDVLKDDVVSFSQARAIRGQAKGQKASLKREPKISEARVDSVLDKGDFSNILAKEAGINSLLSQDGLANNPQINEELNPFDFDALLNSSDDQHTREHAELDNPTYAKPRPQAQRERQNQAGAKTQNNRATKASNKIEWSQDPMLVSMKDEIQALKDMLQGQMSGLAWGNFNRNNPHRAELLQRLCKLGIKPALSETILRQISEGESLEASWKKTLGIIAKGVQVADEDILQQGGVIALVGPTGVGKTTSIAKLAARFTLRYGADEIALVSTDSYRIGAQEQLKTYGQLLRIPVYSASDEKELTQILERLSDKRLVLIDTAGMNQRDIRMTEQLAMLKNAHHNLKLIAVLSASAQSSAVSEVVDVFNSYGLDGCIVSKMDESTSLGGILSVLLEYQITLHYITDGQKVPEDIHRGRVNQLLKTAMGIVREYKDAYDYSDIAMSFAGELLHANG